MQTMTRILGPVLATVLAGSSAASAQLGPTLLNQPLAAPGAPAPSVRTGTHAIEGTIKSVDQARKRVTLEDGTLLTLPPYAKVAPAALKEGAKIIATYEEKGGEKVVSALRVEEPSKS